MKIWAKWFTQLQSILEKSGTHPDILSDILVNTKRWKMNPHTDRIQNHQSPFQWAAFMRGWLSKNWFITQTKFNRSRPKRDRTNPVT